MNLPSNGTARDIRHFFGSLLIFGMIVSIMAYLTQYEIPQTNRDLLTTLVGMLAASLAMIVATITGTRPNELNEAKKTIQSLETKIDMLVSSKDMLEKMVIDLQDQTIDRLLLKSTLDYDDCKSGKCGCKNKCKNDS